MRRVIGRPKDLNKRKDILEAATQLFLELGYEGSSMDKIAKLAGVSKLTIYSHFQDKDQLFSAAIEQVCQQRLPKTMFTVTEQSDIHTTLLHVGCHFLAVLYSPEGMKLTLLMSSLAPHNSDLVQMFYQAGPAPTHKNIENLFRQISTLNKIQCDNPLIASELFITLLTDIHYNRVLWGLQPIPTPAQIESHVLDRLETFVKIYPIQTT